MILVEETIAVMKETAESLKRFEHFENFETLLSEAVHNLERLNWNLPSKREYYTMTALAALLSNPAHSTFDNDFLIGRAQDIAKDLIDWQQDNGLDKQADLAMEKSQDHKD